jgi:LysM repeat protein
MQTRAHIAHAAAPDEHVRGRPNRKSRRALRAVLPAALGLTAALLGGCGQVITLQPTPTPEPTATLSVAVVVATLPPTATPAPYTPEPTATPTVTPTPVVHVIQSGESLLGIATQYNISVATLQDANGILDPRFLQIGEQLIIPRREEIEAAESDEPLTPTPTPLAAAVENVLFSETTIGGLSVLGEVWNNTGQPLEQVRVGVSLLDADGQEIGKADGLVALDLVDIDERAPFAILFGETQGKFAQYRVYPLHAVPAYVGSYYRDLEVNELQLDGERYAAYTATGRIKNIGPEEAVQVQVVITAYDPLGRVVATRKVEPDYNVVPVGGETTFTAVLAPAGGPVARVVAIAQGRRISAGQP